MKQKSLKAYMEKTTMQLKNTYPCLLLSTAHVTSLERSFMEHLPVRNAKFQNRVFVRDSGWFLKLMICEVESDRQLELAFFEECNFSAEHLAVIEYALKRSIPLIEFDMDADQIDDLPVFDDCE